MQGWQPGCSRLALRELVSRRHDPSSGTAADGVTATRYAADTNPEHRRRPRVAALLLGGTDRTGCDAGSPSTEDRSTRAIRARGDPHLAAPCRSSAMFHVKHCGRVQTPIAHACLPEQARGYERLPTYHQAMVEWTMIMTRPLARRHQPAWTLARTLARAAPFRAYSVSDASFSIRCLQRLPVAAGRNHQLKPGHDL
jgi:hypothetical protein